MILYLGLWGRPLRLDRSEHCHNVGRLATPEGIEKKAHSLGWCDMGWRFIQIPSDDSWFSQSGLALTWRLSEPCSSWLTEI